MAISRRSIDSDVVHPTDPGSLRSMEYVYLANFTGNPAISCPMGYAGSVPVGLMVRYLSLPCSYANNLRPWASGDAKSDCCSLAKKVKSSWARKV
jgi:hypothetical protein